MCQLFSHLLKLSPYRLGETLCIEEDFSLLMVITDVSTALGKVIISSLHDILFPSAVWPFPLSRSWLGIVSAIAQIFPGFHFSPLVVLPDYLFHKSIRTLQNVFAFIKITQDWNIKPILSHVVRNHDISVNNSYNLHCKLVFSSDVKGVHWQLRWGRRPPSWVPVYSRVRQVCQKDNYVGRMK